MKRLLTVLIILFSYCIPGYASEQEAIDSFINIVNQIQAGIEKTYTDEYATVKFVEKGKYNKAYWFKQRNGNLSVAYDIKKSDSLISPYNGIIDVSYDSLVYYDLNNYDGHFQTELEAQNAMLKKTNNYSGRNRKFFYAYQNNKWVLKKHSNTLFGDTFWYNVTNEDSISFVVDKCDNISR